LGLSGTWNNETKTASVVGAVAEIATSITSIAVWYDRDSVPGFQWDVVDPAKRYDIYNCLATTTTYDCVDTNGFIDVRDLTWTPINRTETKCTDAVPGGNYNANCTILTFNTTGQLTTNDVMTITARIASQPITINGVLHTPDKTEFDVRIMYPWAAKTIRDVTTAKLAIVALHAGKVAVGGAAATVTGTGTASLTFAAGTGKAAYFGYSSTATIAGASTTVTTQTITGAQIKAATCPLLSPCAGTNTAALSFFLGLYATSLELLGWHSQLTIHSFASVQPLDVFWDPSLGFDAKSGAFVAVPGVLVAILSLLF
jgi:hypothetical protein